MEKPFSYKILGIDPGFSGAIAILDLASKTLISVHPMPVAISTISGKKSVDPTILTDLLRPHVSSLEFAVVEQVSAAPKQGVVSVFSFGQGYGTILGVLGALGVRTKLVVPSVWKGALGLSSDKRQSLALAKKLFPENSESFSLLKHDGLAEASLLAHYGIRMSVHKFQKHSLEDLM